VARSKTQCVWRRGGRRRRREKLRQPRDCQQRQWHLDGRCSGPTDGPSLHHRPWNADGRAHNGTDLDKFWPGKVKPDPLLGEASDRDNEEELLVHSLSAWSWQTCWTSSSGGLRWRRWRLPQKLQASRRTWVLMSIRASPGLSILPCSQPVFSNTLEGPSGLGCNSKSEGEVVEALQPRMVRAMCKANWPAQQQQTELEQATLERATTRDLGSLLERRPSCSQGAQGQDQGRGQHRHVQRRQPHIQSAPRLQRGCSLTLSPIIASHQSNGQSS
jgi:hypothetical protein